MEGANESFLRDGSAAAVCLHAAAAGSEWILHGCDFGCDSDVNFRCEDLTEDYAWM